MKRTQWSDLSGVKAVRRDALMACAKSDYQSNFLHGAENLSGSSLKGMRFNWAVTYSQSREAVLRRVRAAGFDVSERVAKHGARILVIAG